MGALQDVMVEAMGLCFICHDHVGQGSARIVGQMALQM